MDKEVWHRYTAKLYSTMKKNKHVLCREVEIILLSAISQAGGERGARKGR